MNQLSNLSITLRQRPVGIQNSDNFSLTSSPVGEIEENQILIKVIYLSLDPYMSCLLYTSDAADEE